MYGFFLYTYLSKRRICDIYDFFAPFINLLTYLLSYSMFVIRQKNKLEKNQQRQT